MRYDVIEQLHNEVEDAWRNLRFWKERAGDPDPQIDAATVANLIDHLENTIRRLEGIQELFNA